MSNLDSNNNNSNSNSSNARSSNVSKIANIIRSPILAKTSAPKHQHQQQQHHQQAAPSNEAKNADIMRSNHIKSQNRHTITLSSSEDYENMFPSAAASKLDELNAFKETFKSSVSSPSRKILISQPHVSLPDKQSLDSSPLSKTPDSTNNDTWSHTTNENRNVTRLLTSSVGTLGV